MSTPQSATAAQIPIEDIKEWRGETVLGPADAKHGRLEEVYYDAETDLPAFAGVKSGALSKKLTLVPLAGATVGHDHVRVRATRDEFKNAPSFDTDVELSASSTRPSQSSSVTPSSHTSVAPGLTVASVSSQSVASSTVPAGASQAVSVLEALP